MAASAVSAPAWQAHRVPVTGGVLAVHEYRGDGGPPSSGADREALVLLHGFTGSHRSWDVVAEWWCGARRVIAVDLPGHGDTDVGSEIEAYSMERAAAGVETALDALGVTVPALLGYSLGGRLALYFAATRPGRVCGLVLESASPGLATEAARLARRQADEELARLAIEKGVEAFVERWEAVPVLACERRLPPAVRAGLRAQRLRNSAAGLAASLRGMGTGSQPWLGDRLDTVDVPVLLVAGADDAKFVESARFMRERLPDARLAVVEGAGHNVHLERPEEFARIVESFLRPGARRP